MSNLPIHILLLEDSDLDAELLQSRLDRAEVSYTQSRLDRAEVSYTVHRVWTHDDFMAAVTSDNCYDLILADYVLPNFDGMQALELAHRHCPDTPFIFV